MGSEMCIRDIVTAEQRIGNVVSTGYSPGGHYSYAHIAVKLGNQP